MMKLKTWVVSIMGLTLLAACTQKTDVDQENGGPEERTATIQIDLSSEYVDEEIRALTIDAQTNGKPQFSHIEGRTDWTTHCFLRKGADPNVQAYAKVEWEVVNSTLGSIQLKMKGHTLTLLASGTQPLTEPQPGEVWYIAGITGGGTLNEQRTRVDFRYNADKDQALAVDQIRVPLAFGWTAFTVAGPNERAPKISVRMKPQGSLFRVKVNNTTEANTGQIYVVGDVKIYSNALSQNGAFDYSPGTTPVENTPPSFIFDSMTTVFESITRSVVVGLNSSQDVLLWAYPRPSSHLSTSESFSTKIYLPHYKSYASDKSTMQELTARSVSYTSGKGYRTTLFVHRPKIGLEYVVPRDLSASGSEFAPDELTTSAGFFELPEAQQIVGTHWGGYHIPSVEEFNGALFGLRIKYDESEGLTSTSPANISIGGREYQLTSVWGGISKDGDKTTLYTWSLVQSTQYADMKYVVGSRYEIKPRIGANSQVTVTSFFLHGKLDLSGIAPDELSGSRYDTVWSDTRNSYRVSFPLSGLIIRTVDTNSLSGIQDRYTRGVFLTTTERAFMDFYTGYSQLLVNAVEETMRPQAHIRLFTNE